jgi:TolB-like protein
MMKKLIFVLMLFVSGMLCAQEMKTVAVLDLLSEGLSSAEARMLTNRLRANLVKLNLFTVVDRENMEEILEEQAFQLTGCTSEACAVEVGQLLGVQNMITGSVGHIGRLYIIQLNLLNVESGQIERSATYDYQGEIEMLVLEGINTALLQLFGLTMMATESAISATGKSGSLTIESTPSGCAVKIDGRLAGNTPLHLSEISSGVRTIVLSKAGLQDFTSFVNVLPDEETHFQASLRSVYAIVDLKTDIPDAKIYFNDALLAEGVLKNDKINRGNYSIRIEHPDYLTHQQISELRANDTLKQSITMKPKMGMVTIESDALPISGSIKRKEGGLFYYQSVKDREARLEFSETISANLQQGNYSLLLRSPGYYPVLKELNILEGQSIELKIPLIDGRTDYAKTRQSFKRSAAMSIVAGLSGAGLYLLTSKFYEDYQNAATVDAADGFRQKATLADLGTAVCFGFSLSLGAHSGWKYIQSWRTANRLQIGAAQ